MSIPKRRQAGRHRYFNLLSKMSTSKGRMPRCRSTYVFPSPFGLQTCEVTQNLLPLPKGHDTAVYWYPSLVCGTCSSRCSCWNVKGLHLSVSHRPSGADGLPAGQWALPQFSSYTGRHTPVLLSSPTTLFWVCGILACCFWRTGNHMTCPTYSHCSSLSGSHRLHNAVGHMLSVKYLFQSHMEWRFHWDTLDCNFYWGLEWELWQRCYLKI